MVQITAVVVNAVILTGEVDDRFLYFASPDAFGRMWGFLTLHSSVIDPLQPPPYGAPASAMQASLNLFRENQLVFGTSAPFTGDATGVVKVLAQGVERFGNLSLMVDVVASDYLQQACWNLGLEFVVHRVGRELATSHNRV